MNLKINSNTLPLGFKASGMRAHIKKNGKPDMALFYSQTSCVSAGFFTVNKVKAAPVMVCLKHARHKTQRAIIINSGNANAMTGRQGEKDAFEMARLVARGLVVPLEDVFVSSTGVIGRPLPMEEIRKAIPSLIASLSEGGFSDAASAILTTDTFAKKVTVDFKIGPKSVTITGLAKGAGMIAPQVKSATMLAYIFTDAHVSKVLLNKAARQAVELSFNAITIDGCMSTNDSVIFMANGLAGHPVIASGTKEEKLFTEVLARVCLELAKMIIADAEGATKFIEINVRGVKSFAQAKRFAFAVANSMLFKCAMFGENPNWGRIASALGSVPLKLCWEKMDIFLNRKPVFKNGRPVVLKDKKLLKDKNVFVDIDLKDGAQQACVLTCDLSYDYVKINAEYN